MRRSRRRPTRPIAQCGRTFRHLPHATDQGDCPGLDGTEHLRGATCETPACDRDHPGEVRADLEAHRG